MTRRPKLLDLFSGQGGAAMGYHRAGFDVTGVDIVDQPRYPFRFICADALEYVAAHGGEYDLIHASPMCQGYSVMCNVNDNEYPRLIEKTRELLLETGSPYVIENVAGARKELRAPIMLCNWMFGLKTYRHRYFESSLMLLAPHHRRHATRASRAGHYEPGTFISVAGNCAPIALAREVMGIDWMSADGLAEAVPPVMTEYIGVQLMRALEAGNDA